LTEFSKTKALLTVCLLTLVTGCAPLSSSDPDPSLPGVSKDINWCEYEYRIGNKKDVPLCSLYSLTEKQQDFVRKQFGYTVYAYLDFIRAKGYNPKTEKSVAPQIFFVTMELLNNTEVFRRSDKEKNPRIVGRYINKKGWAFVTERAFTRNGYTDLPHELTHWLNDNSKITNNPGFDDEDIADQFEDYYEKVVPYKVAVR